MTNSLNRKDSLIEPNDEFKGWTPSHDDKASSPAREPDSPSEAELARFHRFILPRMTHNNPS
jgi:hypothetical protein